jgi:peptidoglycan/LPS O-acetylase OafA/YrhL
MSTYTGSPHYQGVVALPQNSSSLTTALGNLAFLGSLRFDCLGSNTALWSLAYEFWLYVFFPLLVARGMRGWARAGLLASVVLLTGWHVVAYLPVWSLGAVAAWLSPIIMTRFRIRAGRLLVAQIGAVVSLLTTAVIIRGNNTLNILVADYIVAVPTFMMILALAVGQPHAERTGGRWEKLGSFMANRSYSLYAIHVPILILLCSLLGVDVDKRWTLHPVALILAAALVATVVGCAFAFASATELRTAQLRKRVLALRVPLTNPRRAFHE